MHVAGKTEPRNELERPRRNASHVASDSLDGEICRSKDSGNLIARVILECDERTLWGNSLRADRERLKAHTFGAIVLVEEGLVQRIPREWIVHVGHSQDCGTVEAAGRVGRGRVPHPQRSRIDD